MNTARQVRAIIAVMGLKFSGKGTFSEVAEKEFGYSVSRTRDQILADAPDYGIMKPAKDIDIAEMQQIGNNGRALGGNGYWAKRLFRLAEGRGVAKFLMDGVRHPDEIAALSEAAEKYECPFLIVGTEASFMTRLGRVPGRNDEGDAQLRDVGEVDAVEALRRLVQKVSAMDDADRGIGQPWSGQQVDACMTVARRTADFTRRDGMSTLDDGLAAGHVFLNESTKEEYQASVRLVLKAFEVHVQRPLS